jgi:hypothetical protein
MNADERKALLARAKERRMTGTLSSEDDVVIAGRGITLGHDGVGPHKPTIITPKDLDELIDAVGPNHAERKLSASAKSHRIQREHLTRLAVRRRKKTDLGDTPRIASVALQGVMQGVLSRDDLKTMGLEVYIPKLIGQVSIWQWLFPTIIVRSGSALTFSGAGVHSLVAYKLIVEPNARIVVNQAAVSIDCTQLEVQ